MMNMNNNRQIDVRDPFVQQHLRDIGKNISTGTMKDYETVPEDEGTSLAPGKRTSWELN